MARVIKPPTPLPDLAGSRSVFLAGSIEMGKAIDWQSQVEAALEGDPEVIVLNPRRDEWDASWEQSIDNDLFREQVEWELSGLEQADVIACYFAPETRSPITLLELGLHARSGKLIVACPDGFWRKGNVDVVCRRYKATMVKSLEELVQATAERLRQIP